MLWFLLLSEETRVWEQRLGSWVARCQLCHRDCWQLTFRLWRTRGNGLSPATPFGYPGYGEAYQVRCSGCGSSAMVGHPSAWVPGIGNAFVHETYGPSQAMPQYVMQAFPTHVSGPGF